MKVKQQQSLSGSPRLVGIKRSEEGLTEWEIIEIMDMKE